MCHLSKLEYLACYTKRMKSKHSEKNQNQKPKIKDFFYLCARTLREASLKRKRTMFFRFESPGSKWRAHSWSWKRGGKTQTSRHKTMFLPLACLLLTLGSLTFAGKNDVLRLLVCFYSYHQPPWNYALFCLWATQSVSHKHWRFSDRPVCIQWSGIKVSHFRTMSITDLYL